MGQLGDHLRRLDLNLLLYTNCKLGWDMLAKRPKEAMKTNRSNYKIWGMTMSIVV